MTTATILDLEPLNSAPLVKPSIASPSRRQSRKLHRLSTKKIESKLAPGYHSDGGNLYLQVSPVYTRSWVFRYALNGKSRDMGLGATHTINLAKAREKATDCRRLLLDHIDPIEHRHQQRAQKQLEIVSLKTFSECSQAYIRAHRSSWRSAKHAAQWENTLDTYAGPVIGSLPVQAVDNSLILKILEPIWNTKSETASRLRGRIESVLDRATTRGYRSGDNPARWRGHLDNLLPNLKKRVRVKHHAALPFDQMGSFVVALRVQESVAARALELLILTATRTGEVLGARWSEFDMDNSVWTVLAERMKGNRAYRVPLSQQAMNLLRRMEKTDPDALVFSGMHETIPLSNVAMLDLLKRMGRDDATVHGFRSTFRDWASERTSYSREVCEMALAHTVSDKVEAAYRRGDLFEKRRRLMAEWAKQCESATSGKALPVASLEESRQRHYPGSSVAPLDVVPPIVG